MIWILGLVGLVGSLLLVEQLLNPNSFIQSCFKEIFGGGRGDAYTFSCMISPVFLPNNFRDTKSWECFVKNDGVRSRLIELQSFLLSKIDVDPIHRVFDVSSTLSACTVQDAVLSGRSCQDPCVLCP